MFMMFSISRLQVVRHLHVQVLLEPTEPRRECFFAALKPRLARRDELFLSPTKPF
jgi:hypothetical protein